MSDCSPSNANRLNQNCACHTLDKQLLKQHLLEDPTIEGIFNEIVLDREHLLSSTIVFISEKQYKEIQQIITTIEGVAKNKNYRESVLNGAKHFGPSGVFMGYDFHLGDDGPKLIEINTNAGGALLNYELARAQKKCCPEVISELMGAMDNELVEKKFIQMFIEEWKSQRGESSLKLIAIIDQDPKNQYLYPEFKLFVRLFERNGIRAIIADPKDLVFNNNELTINGEKIDLIYNRLTDFYFEEEDLLPIKRAYESNSVVVTPAPYHHALYANKLNLVRLSDREMLSHWQIPDEEISVLMNGIPATVELLASNQQELWDQRKNLFFKPISGFGSKAIYRGDKITHKVWSEIIHQKYVAQTIATPSKRVISIDSGLVELKMDLRAYTYRGEVQLLAARLYSGQTTNFRTDGGGFAPVYIAKED